MRKTIQELREARGESRADLAAALGVTLDEVTDWELGKVEPGITRVRILTEHFGVRDDQIDLKPGHAASLTERLTDALGDGA
jgi:transcriptional regulator with XRE-family HTH domain